MRLPLALLPLLLLLALAGCGGGGEEQPQPAAERRVTVYSGRAENLVGPLFDRFRRATGVQVDVRYGESPELAATLAEEGANTPADLFFSQDAGSLGAVAQQGLLRSLPADVLDRVDRRFRDDEGRWIGVSGRARVVAYDTRELRAEQLPDTIFAFTEPRWRGKVGMPPGNASFQAFVSAMRLAVGDERTRAWLRGIAENEPTLLENNVQTLEAIARGEVEVGFVNHYYLYELQAERPDLPVANHYLRPGDPGSLVNVAGVGELAGEGRSPEARRLTEFLLSVEGQRYFATDTAEYPLVPGVQPDDDLRPLREIVGPDIALGELGEQLPSTSEMIAEAGLGS